MALRAAFIPGASPPLVNTAITGTRFGGLALDAIIDIDLFLLFLKRLFDMK